MQSLILICGNAGAGKTTAAKIITEKYNKYKEFALGDKVKELTFKLLKIFNVPIASIEDLYDTEKKKQYRYYLQNIATEAIRETLGRDVWCNALYNIIKEEEYVIVSDVRFMNEIEYFMNNFDKVYIIKIVKNDIEIMQHSSETEIAKLPYNVLIDNNGTIKQLEEKIINAVNAIDYYKDIDSSADDFEEDISSIKQGILYNTKNNIALHYPSSEYGETLNDEKDNETNINKDNEKEMKQNDNFAEEIEEEKQANIINVERSVNIAEELKKESVVMIDNKEHNKGFSSYALGKIGEDDIVKMIQTVRPGYETISVAKTGHLGDIHAIDYDRNIKYIIEIKLKQNITKTDIDKFEKDYNDTKETNTQYKHIIGVFISLNSDSIPSKGSLSITKDKIYLTQKYISLQVFDIVFKMIETYLNTIETVAENKQNINYVIPPNVYSLIAALRSQYKDINKEYEMINNMRNHNEEDRKYIDNLLISLDTKKEFVKFLTNEFNDVLPSMEIDLSNKEEERLIKYMKSHDMKKIQKKDLIKEFPTFATEIGSLGKVGFINKYSSKIEKEDKEKSTSDNSNGNNSDNSVETQEENKQLTDIEDSASEIFTETEQEDKTIMKKKRIKFEKCYKKNTEENRAKLIEYLQYKKDDKHLRKADLIERFPFIKKELEKTTLTKFRESLGV